MKTGQRHLLRAHLALATGILCMGSTAIFVKLSAQPGTVSAFYRLLVINLVIVPCWLAKPRPPLAGQDFRLLVVGGAIFAVDMALWNSSLMLIPAATATLLANSAPIWLGLGSLILFRERLSKSFWFGVILALGGVVWLLGGKAQQGIGWDLGNLMAVLASLCYALYLAAIRKARIRVGLMTVMAISSLSSLVTLLLLNLAMGRALLGLPGRAWPALAGLGMMSLAAALGINHALGHLRAGLVSVWVLGQVVVTALLAMPLLGEYLHGRLLLGGVLVLAGIGCVTLDALNQRPRTGSVAPPSGLRDGGGRRSDPQR